MFNSLNSFEQYTFKKVTQISNFWIELNGSCFRKNTFSILMEVSGCILHRSEVFPRNKATMGQVRAITGVAGRKTRGLCRVTDTLFDWMASFIDFLIRQCCRDLYNVTSSVALTSHRMLLAVKNCYDDAKTQEFWRASDQKKKSSKSIKIVTIVVIL